MNRRLRVFVELNDQNQIIRIYRKFPPFDAHTAEVSRKYAVSEIRRQVVERAKGVCENCPRYVGQNGHMHERIFRSHGGEQSLKNCWYLCKPCHDREHEFKKSLRKEREP